jgi:hypothetical protein
LAELEAQRVEEERIQNEKLAEEQRLAEEARIAEEQRLADLEAARLAQELED